MIRWTRYGNEVIIKWQARVRGLPITVIRVDGVWKVRAPGLLLYETIDTGFAHCAKKIALRKVLQALELRQLKDAARIERLRANLEE